MSIRRLALVVPGSARVWEIAEVGPDDPPRGTFWRDVTDLPDVQPGWVLDGDTFRPASAEDERARASQPMPRAPNIMFTAAPEEAD